MTSVMAIKSVFASSSDIFHEYSTSDMEYFPLDLSSKYDVDIWVADSRGDRLHDVKGSFVFYIYEI